MRLQTCLSRIPIPMKIEPIQLRNWQFIFQPFWVPNMDIYEYKGEILLSVTSDYIKYADVLFPNQLHWFVRIISNLCRWNSDILTHDLRQMFGAIFNPSGADTGLPMENRVHTMAADALATCIAWASAFILLNVPWVILSCESSSS